VGALTLAACGQASSSSSAGSGSPSADACSKESLQTLTAGKLTIGTDTPAYPPYFVDDTPSNGKGFESAVAYAVAEQLGFAATDVTWVTVPFDKSFAPGTKNFDFDINQISITDDRKKAVDMSEGYYTVNQAVVALEGSPAASAKTIADLQKLKLGAQVGTTSLTYVNDVVKPTEKPYVFSSTNDAKSALNNKQIDAIVVDLPTAYYITAAEIENSVIVGQFKADSAGGEEFGLVLSKGSPLTQCVDQAITALKDSGELATIQDEWLSKVTNAPYFS
jgi:polar amino acid transport system substrate-binding protein